MAKQARVALGHKYSQKTWWKLRQELDLYTRAFERYIARQSARLADLANRSAQFAGLYRPVGTIYRPVPLHGAQQHRWRPLHPPCCPIHARYCLCHYPSSSGSGGRHTMIRFSHCQRTTGRHCNCCTHLCWNIRMQLAPPAVSFRVPSFS